MQFNNKIIFLFFLNIFLTIIIFGLSFVYEQKIFVWLLNLIPVLLSSKELPENRIKIIALLTTLSIAVGNIIFMPHSYTDFVSYLISSIVIILITWIIVFIKAKESENKRQIESYLHLIEAVFDHRLIPMVYLSTDFKIIRVNDAFAEYDEKPVWKYKDENYFSVLPEDNFLKEYFNKALETGKSYRSTPDQVKRKIIHNRITSWSWQIFPAKDQNNIVKGILLTFNALTEQAEVEKKLKENQIRLNGIISSAMDAIISIDSEQKIILFNKAAETLFKMSASEALGKHIGMFIPHKFRQLHKQYIKAFANTNVSQRSMGSLGEINALRANGEIFPAEASISQVDVNNEKIFSVILRDITERVKNEQEVNLQKERALFLSEITKLLSELSIDYYSALRFAGKISCNFLGDYSGIQIFELEGQDNVKSLLFSLKDQNLQPELRYSKNYNFINKNDFIALSPEKKIVIEQIENSPHLNHDLKKELLENEIKSVVFVPIVALMEFIGVFMVSKKQSIDHIDSGEENFLYDFASRIGLYILNSKNFAEKNKEIEERKKIENDLLQIQDELEKSNKDLEHFAYIASHDMQEPLRMVSNYVELLQKKYGKQLNSEANEFMNYALGGSKKMHRFIKELLEFSKISRKKKLFEYVDLNQVVDDVMHNLQILLTEKDADIKLDKLPGIIADQSQMEQLFLNLMSNAIKFSNHKAPEIEIKYSDMEDHILFSVKDNGRGIDPKYKDTIFAIFQQAGESDSQGTGIGLAICKRIVERHKGKIWYESKLGKGTEFFFTISKNLPLSD